MNVRRAHRGDLREINQMIEPYLGPAFNWPPVIFEGEFEYAETWILEDEGGLRAFICVRNAFEAWELSILATRIEDLRKGYMRRLLGQIITLYGRKRQYWLEVHESNLKAQAFYASLGFRKEGRRGGYYTDGSAALLYSLPVADTPEIA